MKVAIIGMGSMGKKHHRLIKEHFKQHKPVPIHHDQLDKVDGTFDAAFICTPTDTHLKIATEMARRGLHLFVEKPLCGGGSWLRWPPINSPKFIGQCIRSNTTAYVAYPLRFWNGYIDDVSDFVEDFREATFVCRTDSSKWPSKRKLQGVLLELSHEIDLCEHLCGKIKKIEGYGWQDLGAYSIIHYNGSTNKVILDMCSEIEERLVIASQTYHLKVTDDMYIAQLRYFFDNINNPFLMNNVYDASQLISKIFEFMENGRVGNVCSDNSVRKDE